MLRVSILICALTLFLLSSTVLYAQSRPGELRGAWMGERQVERMGRDWPTIMQSLKDNGFNAIFPCFSVGDVSLYPSAVLEQLPSLAPDRDDLALAATAAKANGLELHIWRINFALWRTSPDVIARLAEEDRLQRNSRGLLVPEVPQLEVNWLCPSHPANRELEKAAMLELVRDYDIAGIHFDYLRFPSDDFCFCDGCRERFQAEAKIEIADWPDDVREGGPQATTWQDWRRSLLTSLVEEIATSARALKPNILISAATRPWLDYAYRADAQDWISWSRTGLLDFVCPMTYTTDQDELERLLTRMLNEIRGAVPVYAGLGAFEMTNPWQLIQHIERARETGVDGFVAFAYGSGDFAQWLPDLRATVTAADPGPMPHARPPARFSFSGPASEPPAGRNLVLAGEPLELHLSIGWEPPPLPSDEDSGAAEAMLRRALDPRAPIQSYGDRDLPLVATFDDRLTGRIIAEAPNGNSLSVIGVFDSAYRFERSLTFPAPTGRFRIAVYGTITTSRERRPFVARGPLLIGKPASALAPDPQAKLIQLLENACSQPEVARLRNLAPLTVQLHATEPLLDWWLQLTSTGCESAKGSIDNPDLVVSLTVEDLLALAHGEVSPRLLWETGRLEFHGTDSIVRRLYAAYLGG